MNGFFNYNIMGWKKKFQSFFKPKFFTKEDIYIYIYYIF